MLSVVTDKTAAKFMRKVTAGNAQFPARETSRERDAMMTPFP